MSRPTVPGSHPNALDDVSRKIQQGTPQPSPSLPPGIHPSQRNSPHPGAPQMISLPPLRKMSSTPPTPSSDRRSGNPLGVRSILNPEAEMMEQQKNRRRSASQMESPSPVETQPSNSLPSISRPPSVDSTQDEAPLARPFPPPPRLPHRHMLSPRSPTLHRSVSHGILPPAGQGLGILNPPTGTIDAHQSPFLGGTPVSTQPALPTPPVGNRATYFSTVPTAPTPPPNGPRNDHSRPSMSSFPQSGSASPIASYSPYSQPASVASSQHEGSNQQNSYGPPQTNAPSQDFNNPHITMDTDRGLIPMAPSGQSTIQMMTIKSQQGHHVQIPVDVQAASKVADEKRKRNAGASARFRARRKEKEREASQSITRLEHQLRDAAEDIDFYRSERDYFKSIVFSQPGAERHYARPPSPRLRRLSTAPSNAPSSTAGGSNGSYSGPEDFDDPHEPERNVRRRTSSYHPVPGPPPPGQAPHQAHMNGSASGLQQPPYPGPAASFAPVNPSPIPGPPVSRSHPAQQYDPREQRPPPELQGPGGPRSNFRDPFAADAARHGTTPSWTPGPPRDNRG